MSEQTPRPEPGHDVVEHPKPARTFTTPAWVRPPRPRDGQQHLPLQATPTHDQDEVPAARSAVPHLLEHASWSAPRTSRRVLGALFVVAVVVAVGAGIDAGVTRSTTSAVVALFSLLAAAAIYAGMAASRPMTVELDGSKLVVNHGTGVDVFDLADPFQDVVERGEPGTISWSLTLSKPGGGVILIDARTVESLELHPVIVHAREYAERGRAERRERFNR
jgi:hypothetical protein